jgi:hypothetical protein
VAGRFTDFTNGWNCGNWTANDYVSGSSTYDTTGTTITPAGHTTSLCKVPRVLACCASVYKEKFAGFTPSSVIGAAGGREAMHAHCATSFSGSHMCHMAEYVRAGSPAAPPATGAWLDVSAAQTGATIYPVADLASKELGRYTDFTNGWNCGNWTANTYMSGSSTYDTTGTAISTAGQSTQLCKNPRPVACCF